jgi:hypothetical protein
MFGNPQRKLLWAIPIKASTIIVGEVIKTRYFGLTHIVHTCPTITHHNAQDNS